MRRAECHILHRLLRNNDIDVVAQQEIHVETEEDLRSRGNKPGYDVTGATYDGAYGVSTFVRSNI